jgi:hypothetical protein
MESRFKKGSRVSHPKYGNGTITTVNGDGDRCHVRIAISDELMNLHVSELTLLDATEIDRVKIAKAAMQGLIASGDAMEIELTARYAVQYADALIAELKRTER